jgi:hypothetical protein
MFSRPSIRSSTTRPLPRIALLRTSHRPFLTRSFDACRSSRTVGSSSGIQATSLLRSSSTSSTLSYLTTTATSCLIRLCSTTSTHCRTASHGWERRNSLRRIAGLRRLEMVSWVLKRNLLTLTTGILLVAPAGVPFDKLGMPDGCGWLT